MSKTHTITLAAAQALFLAMGFKTADKWDAERAAEKFANLAKMMDDKGKFDPEELDPDDIKDKKQRAAFDEIHEALKAGKTVEVESEEADEDDEDEKPSKSSKKADKEDADDGDEDEEDEKPSKKSSKDDDDEEDEDEKPAKKSKKDDEDEDSDDEDEKPAKKKAAKKSSGGEKDEHGFRVGTVPSKLAGALSKKAQNHAALVKAAGLSKDQTYYDALSKLVKAKIAVREDGDEGKAWKLRK